MTDRDAPRPSSRPLSRRFAAAAVAFAVIAAVCFGYLRPKLENFQHMTAAANDAITAINVQMQQIAIQEARNAADRARYAALEKAGFLGEQNRLAAAKIFETLRVRHRIASLEYQIEPVEKVTLARLPEEAGLVIMASKISLSMRGYIDSDLHAFIADVARSLPGHVSIASLELTKLGTPDDHLLLQISQGGGTELVSGAVELTWRVVNAQAEAEPGNAQE